MESNEECVDEAEAAEVSRNSSFLVKDEGKIFVLNVTLTDYFKSQKKLNKRLGSFVERTVSYI